MERYTKGERGQRIHYRYTKETDAEFIERTLQGFARDNKYLAESEIRSMIENFIVAMGFSRNEEKRKSEVLRLLMFGKVIMLVIPLVIALAVRTLWVDWGETSQFVKLQKEVRYEQQNSD